jgi:hypothetical protein
MSEHTPDRADDRTASTATDAHGAATADGIDPAVDVDVPRDAEAYECRYCGRRVPSARLLDLHRGLAHPDALDDDEVAAFRDAYDDEAESVNRFRIVALGGLVALYFGFLFVYVVVA